MDHDLVAGLPLGDALADLPDDAGGVGAADVMAPLGVVAVVEHRDGLAERRPDVVEVDPAAITRTITSKAPGSGSSTSSSLKASFGSPSRSAPDHPGGHRLGQLARLDVQLRDLGYVYGQARDPNAAMVAVRFPSGAATTFVGSHGSFGEATAAPRARRRGRGDGVVRALDDRLVIERLTVTDERAARVVRERAEAGQQPAAHGLRRDRDRRSRSRPRGRRPRRSTTCAPSSSAMRRSCASGSTRVARGRRRAARRADLAELRRRAATGSVQKEIAEFVRRGARRAARRIC